MLLTKRWITFNAVGVAGFAVQLVMLAGLLRLGMHLVAVIVCSTVNFAAGHRLVWTVQRSSA